MRRLLCFAVGVAMGAEVSYVWDVTFSFIAPDGVEKMVPLSAEIKFKFRYYKLPYF